VEEEEEVAVVRTTTSRRHGRSARCLLGTREKKDGDGGRAIGCTRIRVDEDEKAIMSPQDSVD
jgi:hypothetical protein